MDVICSMFSKPFTLYMWLSIGTYCVIVLCRNIDWSKRSNCVRGKTRLYKYIRNFYVCNVCVQQNLDYTRACTKRSIQLVQHQFIRWNGYYNQTVQNFGFMFQYCWNIYHFLHDFQQTSCIGTYVILYKTYLKLFQLQKKICANSRVWSSICPVQIVEKTGVIVVRLFLPNASLCT